MEIDRPIIIALILVAIILLNVFLVFPAYNNLQMQQENLALKKAEYNAQYDYYAQIAKDYYVLETSQDGVQKIDDALPTSSDLGQVTYYLQLTAKNNGLIFKSLVLSEATQTGDVKNIIFSAELSGDYFSLENFIATLEQSSRLFEIDNISFGSASQVVTPSSTAGSAATSAATAAAPPTQFQDPGIFNFQVEIKTHSY